MAQIHQRYRSSELRSLRLTGIGVEQYGEVTIELGPAAITYLSACLEDPAAVRAQLAADPATVRLCFTPGDSGIVERRYTDWLRRRRGARVCADSER